MANILFVVNAVSGTTPTNANELSLYNLMTSFGHTVTGRAHSNADKSGTGFDLVVLSSNTTSGNLTGYASISQPVLNLAHATWDTEFNLQTGTSATSTTAATTVYDLNGANPVVIYSAVSSARYIAQTSLSGTFTVLYRFTDINASSVAAWFVPSGGTLANGGTSPGNRLASWPLNEAVPNLSTAGQTAFSDIITTAINGPSGGDSTAPSQPTNVVATVNSNDVTLTWTASTDNIGVDHYDVHRDTNSSTFTATTGNRIAQPTATTYIDTNRPTGTTYYRVIAYDVAGNPSTVSAVAAATIGELASGYYRATSGAALEVLRWSGSAWV